MNEAEVYEGVLEVNIAHGDKKEASSSEG